MRAPAAWGDITLAKDSVNWFDAIEVFGVIRSKKCEKKIFIHMPALEKAGLGCLDAMFDFVKGRDDRQSAWNTALA